MTSKVYNCPPSLADYLQSDNFIDLVVGPVGSTKTTTSIIKILREASRVAPCPDGVRRSRAVWVRNTAEQLRDTSIKDFLQWFGEAGDFRSNPPQFDLRVGDVHCEVLFRGLDDSKDVRRLLSLQLSFAVMDEFREINTEIFAALQSRVGRYPSKAMNGVGCAEVLPSGEVRAIHKVWGATNPPDYGTPWEEFLTNPPKNASVFFQPSGMSPEADWLQYLPDDYYQNLMDSHDDDWNDIYVHAKFGASLSGKPVWRCFDRETHVAKTPLRPLSGTSVVIGVDAGLNPSATLTQQTYDGRVMVLDSVTGNAGGMGALRFCREILKPLLANKYQGLSAIVIIDPAAFQRAQTDERTVADIFKSEGFFVKPAKTNSIAARLGAVESYLTRTVNGNSAMLIDPGADVLVKAMAGKYRYKTNTKGETDTTPEKSHPFSDLCFTAGTPIATPDGFVPIEALRVGDAVAVPDGVDFVTATGTREAQDLVAVVLSDGTTLTCTPDHPFFLENNTLCRADALQYGDTLAHRGEGKWANGKWRTREKWRYVVAVSTAAQRLLYLAGNMLKAKACTAPTRAGISAGEQTKGWSLTDTGLRARGKTSISGTKPVTGAQSHCTDTCGSSTTGLCLQGMKSTTSTETLRTTLLRIWRVLKKARTQVTTSRSASTKEPLIRTPHSKKPASPLPPGTDPKQGVNGIASTLLPLRRALSTLVRFAVPATNASSGTTSGTTAPLRVIRSSYVGSGRVFNLTTSRTHTYYAGNALVHNCDSLQYACLHHDGGALFGGSAVSIARREVKPAPFRWAV